jgi:hypothetical protein
MNELFKTAGKIDTLCKTGVDSKTLIPLKDGFKTIGNISPGDILDNGETVTGIDVHKVNENTFYSMNGVIGTRSTLFSNNGSIVSYKQLGNECSVEPDDNFIVFQLITESSTFPVLDINGNRVQMVDELQTTDSFLLGIKDSMIVSH